MLIIVILISVSLTIALLFLGAFVWSMKSGQYEDMYGPSVRMLFEDKSAADKQGRQKNQQPAVKP